MLLEPSLFDQITIVVEPVSWRPLFIVQPDHGRGVDEKRFTFRNAYESMTDFHRHRMTLLHRHLSYLIKQDEDFVKTLLRNYIVVDFVTSNAENEYFVVREFIYLVRQGGRLLIHLIWTIGYVEYSDFYVPQKIRYGRTKKASDYLSSCVGEVVRRDLRKQLKLTPRRLEICELIVVKKLKKGQIANKLKIKLATVQDHTNDISGLIDAKSAPGLCDYIDNAKFLWKKL